MASKAKDEELQTLYQYDNTLEPLKNLALGLHSVAGALWSIAGSFRSMDTSLAELSEKAKDHGI